MKRLMLKFIRGYQILFSQGIFRILFLGSSCRFSPSCSEYTYQAIKKYGTIKGLKLGLRQLLKCHPFSKVG